MTISCLFCLTWVLKVPLVLVYGITEVHYLQGKEKTSDEHKTCFDVVCTWVSFGINFPLKVTSASVLCGGGMVPSGQWRKTSSMKALV